MSNFIVLATTFIIVTPNLVRSNEGDGLDVTFATNGDSETQIVCVVNDGGMRGFRGVKDVELQVFPCVEENMDYCQSVAMSPGNKLRCHTVCCASFKARTTTSTKAHLHVMITTTSLPRRTSTSWIDLSTAQKPKMMAASHNASTSIWKPILTGSSVVIIILLIMFAVNKFYDLKKIQMLRAMLRGQQICQPEDAEERETMV